MFKFLHKQESEEKQSAMEFIKEEYPHYRLDRVKSIILCRMLGLGFHTERGEIMVEFTDDKNCEQSFKIPYETSNKGESPENYKKDSYEICHFKNLSMLEANKMLIQNSHASQNIDEVSSAVIYKVLFNSLQDKGFRNEAKLMLINEVQKIFEMSQNLHPNQKEQAQDLLMAGLFLFRFASSDYNFLGVPSDFYADRYNRAVKSVASEVADYSDADRSFMLGLFNGDKPSSETTANCWKYLAEKKSAESKADVTEE